MTFSTANNSSPEANAMAAGSGPNAAPPTAADITTRAMVARRLSGIWITRCARGTQPYSPANADSDSGGPCMSNTSPAWMAVDRNRLTERCPRREIASKFRPYLLRKSISLAWSAYQSGHAAENGAERQGHQYPTRGEFQFPG